MSNQPDQPYIPQSLANESTLTRHDPTMKCSKQEWATIRSLAESGKPYAEIAADYPITARTIQTYACTEKWATPSRIAKAAKGKLAADDPATAVSLLWKERGSKSREAIYNGAQKSLDNFFALSPTPANFQEAAIAKKMIDDTIQPPNSNDSKHAVNLAILTTTSFTPTDTIDV